MLTQKQLDAIDRVELCSYDFYRPGSVPESGDEVAIQCYNARHEPISYRENKPDSASARAYAAKRFPTVPVVEWRRGDAKPYPEYPRPLREALGERSRKGTK